MTDLQLPQDVLCHTLLQQLLAHPLRHLGHQICYVPWQLPLQLLLYLPGLVRPKDLYITKSHIYCMTSGAQCIATIRDQCVCIVW